ncbi:MAG: hypothetical protein IJT96_01400 [Lachnospiraceae bacterium]|nr:hypothetical protein [Lachnospiraceae bacterium]
MGDVFYRELKEASRDIASIKGKAKTSGNKVLLDTAKQIMKLSLIVRREGLPVMEAFTHKIEDKSIAAMMMYAIDGTSTEILEDICWSKYFASELSGYDALIYMLWLKGIISMQEGENPVVISEFIKAMLPSEVVGDFDKICSEEISRAMASGSDDGDMKAVLRVCEEEIEPEMGTDAYILMRIAEYIFTKILDEKALGKILEEADDEALSSAMKGFNSKTRKVLFDNMPKEEAALIAGNMEFMGPVLKKHITESAYAVFEIAKRLMDDGEIEGDATLLNVMIE